MTNQPGATADDPLHVKRRYPSRRTRVVGGEPVDPVHQLRPVGGVGAGRPPLRWRRRGWWWGWGRGQGRGVLQLIDQGLDRGLQRGDPVLRGGHGVVMGRWPIRAARTRVMPAAIWAPSGRAVQRIMDGRERIVRGQFTPRLLGMARGVCASQAWRFSLAAQPALHGGSRST